MKQFIICLTLFCLIFSSHASLYANSPPFADAEDVQRTQISRVVAILTVAALVGGIAWAATGSNSHHKHHHSSGSYSSSSNRSSNSSTHHHRSSSEYSSEYSFSNPYSIFSENNVSSFSDSSSSEEFNFQSIPKKKMKGSPVREALKDQISGLFVSNPQFSSQYHGSVSPYVQLPDGSKKILGSMPLSSQTSSSLPYGPFDQKGTYTFGVRIEQGSVSPNQFKIGSIDIDVNGSTIQRHDFILPAHSPANLELSSCSFDL